MMGLSMGCVAFLAILAVWILQRQFRKRALTAYSLFFCGIFLVYFLGYLSIFIYPDVYVLQGRPERMLLIFPSLLQLLIISIVFLRIQKGQGTHPGRVRWIIRPNLRWKRALTILAVSYFLFMICLIKWRNAPLFNIGRFNHLEMWAARQDLYQGFLLEMTAPIRMGVYYLVAPSLCFLQGQGIRVSKVFLGLAFFFSLIALTKTMFVLMVVFFFLGIYLRTGQLRQMGYMFATILGGFYFIVHSAYASVTDRAFLSVVGSLAGRVVQVPISLAALYAERYPFEAGRRISDWYTIPFGGKKVPMAAEIFSYLSPGMEGNAPTGIVGAAFPNVPLLLHPIYFLVFVWYVWWVSERICRIKKPMVKGLLTIVFGLASWFILLTDPLTAMNTYGLLYLGLFCVWLSHRQSAELPVQPA